MNADVSQIASVVAKHDTLVVRRGEHYCTRGAPVLNRAGFHQHVAEAILAEVGAR